MAKINTYLGELEVKSVYKSSLGFFAITGEGLSRRTWTITASEYERIKREIEDSAGDILRRAGYGGAKSETKIKDYLVGKMVISEPFTWEGTQYVVTHTGAVYGWTGKLSVTPLYIFQEGRWKSYFRKDWIDLPDVFMKAYTDAKAEADRMIKKGVGSEPTDRQKFIEKLKEALLDEAEAAPMYDILAREALALGLPEEAAKLREISADESKHWTILDKIVRLLEHPP